MNPFDHISASLTGKPAWPFVIPAEPQGPAEPTKTSRMRDYLRTHGAANAATLADEADLPDTGVVSALLKADLARGSVYRRGHKFHWNPQFEIALQKQLTDAANLLRSHGFTVKKEANPC